MSSRNYALELVEDDEESWLRIRHTGGKHEKFYNFIMAYPYSTTKRWWNNKLKVWEIKITTEKILQELKDWFDKNGWKLVNTIKPITDYIDIPKETSNNGLPIIKNTSPPMSLSWAERVLQEQVVMQQLLEESDSLTKLEFNPKNSREIFLEIQVDAKKFETLIKIPLRYPEVVPVVSKTNDTTKEHVFFTGRSINSFMDTVHHACLGMLNKGWHKHLGIAHYTKKYILYLTNEIFRVELKNE